MPTLKENDEPLTIGNLTLTEYRILENFKSLSPEAQQKFLDEINKLVTGQK